MENLSSNTYPNFISVLCDLLSSAETEHFEECRALYMEAHSCNIREILRHDYVIKNYDIYGFINVFKT